MAGSVDQRWPTVGGIGRVPSVLMLDFDAHGGSGTVAIREATHSTMMEMTRGLKAPTAFARSRGQVGVGYTEASRGAASMTR